ncbi:hypothetical protein GCM10018790_58260 [Kitasatospora xanthocidica]|nr:hypothetical protein GCM10018790_58260 [Kitasatospora xanthocidica]
MPAPEAQARPVSPVETMPIRRSVSQLDLPIVPPYSPAELPSTLCRAVGELLLDVAPPVCGGAEVAGAGALTPWVSTDGVNGAGPWSDGPCAATSLAVGMASLWLLWLLTISTVATTATTRVPAASASPFPERHHGVGRLPPEPPEPPEDPGGPEGGGGTVGGPAVPPPEGRPASGPDGGPEGGPYGGSLGGPAGGGWEVIEAPFRRRPAITAGTGSSCHWFPFSPGVPLAATAGRPDVAERAHLPSATLEAGRPDEPDRLRRAVPRANPPLPSGTRVAPSGA